MVLRPTVFHNYAPDYFCKSVHQGYLSEGGCLLFHYDAADDKYLTKLDEDKPLFDQLWPGQLIVPKWSYNKWNLFTYTAIILLWLYTDLPDVVSPTPGICVTNQLSRMIIPILEYMERPTLASKLREEIQVNYSSFWAQWAFFLLHVIKVSVLTLFLRLGIANPITFNPIKVYQFQNGNAVSSDHVKAILKSIGWIGSRRGTYDQYQSNFYSYTIKKYGGPVQAYRAGVIKTAANPGVELNAGEGFQTPLDQRFTNSTFETMESQGKFVLSEEYFIELEDNLKENLNKCNGDIGKMNEEIRRFRKFGIYEPSEKLAKMVQKRKQVAKEQKEQEEEVQKSAKLEKKEAKKEQ